MKTLVSVVVPFFNEEENITPLAEKIDAVFAQLPGYDYECLFVNDGSTDTTHARIDALAAAHPPIRPVHLARNHGQSAALLTGMRRAKGEYILTLDGDLQNDPADFPKILELLKNYDCGCGYRAKRKDNWARRFSGRIANKVRNTILHDGIRDAGCGTKGFRRHCIEHIIPFNGVHRFFAVMLRNAGLTLAECEAAHHPRIHGVSKYSIHNRLWRGIYDLVGVAWLTRRYMTIEIEEETPRGHP